MCTYPTPIRAEFLCLYVGRGGVKALGSQTVCILYVDMFVYVCMIVSLVLVLAFPQPRQKVKTPSPADPLPPKKGGHCYTLYRVALLQCWWICMYVHMYSEPSLI